jgi:spore germination protein GerM
MLALAVLAACSGCVDNLLRERADARPLPPMRSSVMAPFGDYRAMEDIPVTLYLPDWNRDRLVAAADTVSVYAGEDITEAVAARELARLSPLFPNLGGAELRLSSVDNAVERSGGVVVVNLDANIWLLEPSEKSVVRMALTYALTGLPGVEYVGVLVSGRDEAIDSGGAVPYGLHSRPASEDIESYLNGLDTLASSESAGLSRDAALYFATADGRRALPEARAIVIPPGPRETLRERLVSAILTEMALGSRSRPSDASRLPIEYMIGEPRLFNPGGSADTLLQLSFRGELADFLTVNGGSLYLLFASLTETLTGFVPGLDGLTIQLGGDTVTELRAPDRTIHLTNGRMGRADFAGVVAALSTLYFPNGDGGGLVAVERAVGQGTADDPRQLLRMLLAGPQQYDSDTRLLPALPAEDGTPSAFTDADLLGVTIVSGEALVNLSEDAASACADLTASQARSFIFSVVNTLTELRGVDRARFFIDSLERDLFYQPESGGAADARPSDLTGGGQSGVTSLGEFYRQPGLIITDFGNIDEPEQEEGAGGDSPADSEAAYIDEV